MLAQVPGEVLPYLREFASHHPFADVFATMGQVQSAFDPDSQVPVVYDNPKFPSLYNPTFDSTVEGEGYFLHDAYGE